MPLSAAIFAQLSADAATTAIVSGRIYPGFSPEGIYPLVSYAISGQPDDAINPSPTQRYDVVITCVAFSYATAQQLAAAVRAALDRQVWTTGSTTVQSCLFENSDETSFTENGNPEQIYHVHDVTFTILSSESQS